VKEKIKKLFGSLFIAVAIVCLIAAYQQWKLYQEGSKEYEEIAENHTEEPGDNEDDDDFSIDWDALFAQNPDLVGWIRMSPTANYPIVKGTDNSFYLKHGFDKSYNINGCIFMHYQNSKDWTDKNTIVYGHNMISGAMFGNNDYYKDISYAKEHPYFFIYTPDGMYTYKIFDTITAKDATDPYEINIDSEESFGEYLEKMNQMKDYGLDTQVSTKDRIVTLSTCTSQGNKRFIIQGVLYSFTDTSKNVYKAEELRNKEETESISATDSDSTVFSSEDTVLTDQ